MYQKCYINKYIACMYTIAELAVYVMGLVQRVQTLRETDFNVSKDKISINHIKYQWKTIKLI